MTTYSLIETTVSSFDEVDDVISGTYVKRGNGFFPFELSRQFISVAQKGTPHISQIYKEILQFFLNQFSTLSVLGKEDILIPVNTIFGAPERSIAKQIQDDNLKLPIISITQIGDENDDGRRRFRPLINIETSWNPKTRRAERILSLVPRPVKITYLINIWGEYLEDVDQIKEQIFSLFNPALTVVTKFSNNTCAFLNELGDQSAFIVPDREDRLLKKQFEIVVEAYIPTKRFLYTSTGEIREFILDVNLSEPETEASYNTVDSSTSGVISDIMNIIIGVQEEPAIIGNEVIAAESPNADDDWLSDQSTSAALWVSGPIVTASWPNICQNGKLNFVVVGDYMNITTSSNIQYDAGDPTTLFLSGLTQNACFDLMISNDAGPNYNFSSLFPGNGYRFADGMTSTVGSALLSAGSWFKAEASIEPVWTASGATQLIYLTRFRLWNQGHGIRIDSQFGKMMTVDLEKDKLFMLRVRNFSATHNTALNPPGGLPYLSYIKPRSWVYYYDYKRT